VPHLRQGLRAPDPDWRRGCLPSCHWQDLERLLSSFAVNSGERSNATLQAARKRLTQSDSRREKLRHEQKEIREHVREDYGIKVPEPKD
jgi:hypothetical protein